MKWRIWRYVVGRKRVECPYCGKTKTVWSIIGSAWWMSHHVPDCSESVS